MNVEFLDDGNLSWSAKGLLSYFLVQDNEWCIDLDDLDNHYENHEIGKEEIISFLQELIELGYCETKKFHKEREYFFRGGNNLSDKYCTNPRLKLRQK